MIALRIFKLQLPTCPKRFTLQRSTVDVSNPLLRYTSVCLQCPWYRKTKCQARVIAKQDNGFLRVHAININHNHEQEEELVMQVFTDPGKSKITS